MTSGTYIERRFWQTAPFVGVAVLALFLTGLAANTERLAEIWTATGATVALAALAVVLPWDRLPGFLQVVPALGFLAVVALLEDAEGGSAPGYSALVVLPIIWLALYSSRRALVVGLTAAAATLVVPILVDGAAPYPDSEWRRAVITIAVSAVAGFTVERLVRRTRELSSKLAEQARVDALTGLANRRVWDDELLRELERADRDQSPLSVALLDIDHFKELNDSLGHQAGDAVLKDCGERWMSEIRRIDVLARYGGDEFGLILPACGLDDAVRVVERLRAATPQHVTCSAGVVQWHSGDRAEELVGRADRLLYAAKRAGRDRVLAEPQRVSAPSAA